MLSPTNRAPLPIPKVSVVPTKRRRFALGDGGTALTLPLPKDNFVDPPANIRNEPHPLPPSPTPYPITSTVKYDD
jgi:hypothetical protein